MRLTRAHGLAALAVAVPVTIFIGIALFLPSPGEERSAADHLAVFAVLTSFLGFLTLALFAARPESRWLWRARNALLAVIVVVLGVTGCILIGAAFTLSIDWFLIYGLWFPGGIAVLRSMYKESLDDSGVTKELPNLTPFRLMAAHAAPFAAVLAVAIAIGFALAPLGLNTRAVGLILYPIGLAIPASWLLAALATRVLNQASSRAGVPTTVLASVQWMRGHRWRPMPDDEAGRAWSDAGRLPAGARLLAGWICDHCPIVRLQCVDRDGRPYALYLRPPKLPWGEWIAGPFVARVDAGSGGRSRLQAGVFQRLDCPWTPMPAEWLEARLAEAAPNAARDRAIGWVCLDCGSERFDLVDARGDDFLLIRNPGTDELRWAAGCFFAFSRRPTLASERPPEPTVATEPA